MSPAKRSAVEMTVVESPIAGLPTFPPLDYGYIFFKTYPERSRPHRLHLLPSGSFFD